MKIYIRFIIFNPYSIFYNYSKNIDKRFITLSMKEYLDTSYSKEDFNRKRNKKLDNI